MLAQDVRARRARWGCHGRGWSRRRGRLRRPQKPSGDEILDARGGSAVVQRAELRDGHTVDRDDDALAPHRPADDATRAVAELPDSDAVHVRDCSTRATTPLSNLGARRWRNSGIRCQRWERGFVKTSLGTAGSFMRSMSNPASAIASVYASSGRWALTEVDLKPVANDVVGVIRTIEV